MARSVTELEIASRPVQVLDAVGEILGTPSNPIPVREVEADISEVNQGNIVIQYLLNSGSKNMNVDGSSSAVTFSAVPPAGKKWVISRLLIYFSTSQAFDETGFGSLAALTNGIDIVLDGVSILNWKDNIDINTSMFDADGKELYTKKDKSLSGRFTFSRFTGMSGGVTVRSPSGFAMKIRDDLSSLTIFRARIEGVSFDD